MKRQTVKIINIKQASLYIKNGLQPIKVYYDNHLVFEFDTVRYDPELYRFEWNSRGNLEGYEKSSGQHKFTWQPSGSQFTIIENVPEERLHIEIKSPEPLDKEEVLEAVHFDDSWYRIVSYAKKIMNNKEEI